MCTQQVSDIVITTVNNNSGNSNNSNGNNSNNNNNNSTRYCVDMYIRGRHKNIRDSFCIYNLVKQIQQAYKTLQTGCRKWEGRL